MFLHGYGRTPNRALQGTRQKRRVPELDVGAMARRPQAFLADLRGRRVSHVWRGYGSALFLEFGELAKTRKLNGKPGQPVGDLSLMVEWSWRVENKNTILGGSWSNERR